MLNVISGLLGDGAGGGGANSFESIATVTGNGTTNTYTFSSIAGTYKHLQLRCSAIYASTTGAVLKMQFNGDTATTYSYHDLQGSGTAAAAAGAANASNLILTSSQQNGIITYPNVAIADIIDYASTSKNKTIRSFYGAEQNAAGGEVGITSGVWRSTAAITSITIFTSPNLNTGTTFALYGIKG